mmetsp:Transcript_6427/g.15948  ORF Transcript_6427/g.15948 Transcript_6427/m.15948 type:complete len:223 (+) Transcript_6427:462-1130(+)
MTNLCQDVNGWIREDQHQRTAQEHFLKCSALDSSLLLLGLEVCQVLRHVFLLAALVLVILIVCIGPAFLLLGREVGVGIFAEARFRVLEIRVRVECKVHHAGYEFLEADESTLISISGVEHLLLRFLWQVLSDILEDHTELLKVDLVVAIEVIVPEERRQKLAHPSNFIESGLVHQCLLQVFFVLEVAPTALAELGQRPSQGQLAVPQRIDSCSCDGVVDGA